jgi:hypothetical protein
MNSDKVNIAAEFNLVDKYNVLVQYHDDMHDLWPSGYARERQLYCVYRVWVDLVYRSSLGAVDFGREMIVG